jgi:acyl carrier protein
LSPQAGTPSFTTRFSDCNGKPKYIRYGLLIKAISVGCSEGEPRMQRECIVERVNDVFREDFEMEPQDLVPEANVFLELGLDSLDVVDLVVALQKKFNVSIRDDERIREIRTLNDLYNFIEAIGNEMEGD